MIELISGWMRSHWQLMLILSGLTMVASLASVSAIIISLPPNYFTRKKHVSMIRNPILRVLWIVVKNVVGAFALIAGFIMLFTPGQGILTLFVGVILCDFPSKRRIERNLIARPLVLTTINRIRVKYRRPPIMIDERRQRRRR